MLTSAHTCTALQGGQLTPIDLIVEERFHRAAPGGMGGTKAAGNYSPVSVHAHTHTHAVCRRESSRRALGAKLP